ncbi:MAG: ABC transporter ATP-binding protein [Planctomycetota bacterium]|nr:ABC transporter ATP-binding protein [Planctomycetota bacterium]
MRLESLAAGYGGRPVVGPLTIDIRPGEFIAVIGSNGSGKSSLLRTLAGVQRACGGRVLVDGCDLHQATEPARAQALAYVDQHPSLAIHLSAREVMELGAWRGGHGVPGGISRVEAVIDTLRLQDLAEAPWPELSEGQQQRVAIGRALVQEVSGVLVLDEPFASLDTMMCVVVAAALMERVRGGSIVVASIHDACLAEALATRVLRADRAGPGPSLVQDLSPERAFDPTEFARHAGVPFWEGVAGGQPRCGPDWRRAIEEQVGSLSRSRLQDAGVS